MNQDQKRRDEIMALDSPKYVGGLERFEELTAEQLELLIKEDFAALTDVQNSAPSTGDFLNFMKAHPEVSAQGYVVGGARTDYRVRLDGLIFFGKATEELKKDFETFSAKADDLKIEKDELYSWWD